MNHVKEATKVIKFVATELSIDPQLIITKDCRTHVVRAREIVCFILRDLGFTFQIISECVRYKDPTGPIDAVQRLENKTTHLHIVKKFKNQNNASILS